MSIQTRTDPWTGNAEPLPRTPTPWLRSCAVVLALVAPASVVVPGFSRAVTPGTPDDLEALLNRVAARVAQYYQRARDVICLETVRLQSLGSNLAPEGYLRVLAYELRVSWEPAPDASTVPEATILREIRAVNGRPPRPVDARGCMDPQPVSPEPLAMFLSQRRQQYEFLSAGVGRVGDRRALMIDYRSMVKGAADVTWTNDCVRISIPGRTRGRVWIDEATGEVLRLDEHLVGQFETPVPAAHARFGAEGPIVVERSESSIRYRSIAFRDPEETIVLPASIETLRVMRGVGVPRLRTWQVFSNYKRFITDARLVKDSDAR